VISPPGGTTWQQPGSTCTTSSTCIIEQRLFDQY
jgi:hypothetical protein